jgi:RNA polymerase sigma factor (sigma-70 family)
VLPCMRGNATLSAASRREQGLARHARRYMRRSALISDRSLIRACRRGDVGAWKSVLDRYERLVFSVPRRYGLSPEDAADITQLTFTILIQSMETLSEDSTLGAWLVTVARRHTWRLLDRNRRKAASEHAGWGEDTAILASNSSEDIEHWELGEWLHHGLALISEDCRDLLTALYLEPGQPSYADVAARLGMAVGSVGPTRIRCLKRLRQVLGD